MSRTALYRFFDADGDLLYVGISVAPWARWKQHKGEKDWAEDVATSTMEWFDTRPEALSSEKAAIIAEEPRYNVVHNRAARASATVPLLTIVCHGCKEPVEDGQGVVECDWGTAIRNEREQEKIRRARDPWAAIDMRDVMENPVWQEVPWRAWHYACDPEPDLDTYWFAVERCRTLADLFDWVGHLGEKSWIEATNWTDVIRGIAWGQGPLRLDPHILGKQS